MIEKQERGSIHYHVIFFGLPYIKKPELQEIWNKGFVKNGIEKFGSLGRYLIKYMTIDIATGRAEKQIGILQVVDLGILYVDTDGMIEY